MSQRAGAAMVTALHEPQSVVQTADDLDRCMAAGWLVLAADAVVEAGVDVCHPTRSGERRPVVVGPGCLVRSGTVLYSGVRLGAGTQTGHHVVVREDTEVGEESVLGTAATVEERIRIGSHVLVETQAHLAGLTVVEDYAFVGPACVTANDPRMLHRRAGVRENLVGPVLRWGCRLGAGVVVLPGVTVGREALVAAGAVVARDVPDRTVAAGNPVRVIGPIPDGEEVLR
jgi:acetyltransferase-like isoleucine patch superfamily enzyme